MTSRDFCYWLQGLFELSNPQSLTVDQTNMVKQHLAMVFVHEIDPTMGDKAKQSLLTALHEIKLSETGPFAVGSLGGVVDTPNGPVRYRC